MHPKMLITWLLPDFWGSPLNMSYRYVSTGEIPQYNFIGLLPLLFASSSLLSRKHRPLTLTLAVLALFSVLFSFGNFFPTGKLFFHVPVLNIFRVPQRIMCVFVFLRRDAGRNRF